MPQHIWVSIGMGRLCEDCRALQMELDGEWIPAVYPICRGYPDGDHAGGQQPEPPAPAGGQLVLEFA